jgi:hypothetical protein
MGSCFRSTTNVGWFLGGTRVQIPLAISFVLWATFLGLLFGFEHLFKD